MAVPRIRHRFLLGSLQRVPAHASPFCLTHRDVDIRAIRQGHAEHLNPRHAVDACEPAGNLGILWRQHFALRLSTLLRLMREEQCRGSGATVYHEVGVRDLDARQVVEVIGLPKQVARGFLWAALEKRDRALADGFRDPLASGGELLAGEISLIHASRSCCLWSTNDVGWRRA